MLKEPDGHLGEAALHLSVLALASDPRVCPVGVIAACLTLYLAGIGDKSRRAAACGRAQLLAKSAHAGHLRLPAELLEVAENSGNSKGSEFGISEKCCILEKSRKNLVKFGENSAKFWQNLRNFGKKQQKIQQFLTKILRLESGAKECIV